VYRKCPHSHGCGVASRLGLVSLSPSKSAFPSTYSGLQSSYRTAWLAPNNLGAFVHKLVEGRAVCLEADAEQAQNIRDRNPSVPLTPLVPDPLPDQQGLRIILRGTSQLRGFPLATEAFKRAAARWEAAIQTRVTIVIDVDFGTTLFGKSFAQDVVASSDAQTLSGNALYPAVRSGLISKAIAPQRASLLNSLPLETLSTDGGESEGSPSPQRFGPWI
jgi:hypothetical protein